MVTNYNVILLPISSDGVYSEGDIFKAREDHSWRVRKFDGLRIHKIDYCWGVRLHFDWNEWKRNVPKIPKAIPYEGVKRYF